MSKRRPVMVCIPIPPIMQRPMGPQPSGWNLRARTGFIRDFEPGEVRTSGFHAKSAAVPCECAVTVTSDALARHRFGVLSGNVQPTLRTKIGKEIRPYRIFGACEREVEMAGELRHLLRRTMNEAAG
jgi:hypothetical protein